MRTTKFEEDLARGKETEAVLDKLFSKWYEVRPLHEVPEVALDLEKEKGIDRIFRRDRTVWTIEYKRDEMSETTGNICIELESNKDAGTVGWAKKSQAQWLVICQPNREYIFLAAMTGVKRALTLWIEVFPTKPTGDNALSVLVPIEEFRPLCLWHGDMDGMTYPILG